MACGTSTTNAVRRKRTGLTLIEGLIASVVLGLAVVGIFAPISASYKQAEAAEHSSVAMTLARQLLDEISSKPFDEPDSGGGLGPEADETLRGAYDNIDDYHGYSDSTAADAAAPLRTTAGVSVLLAQHGTFTRSVTTEYRATPQGTAVASGNFLLVTVRVTRPDGGSVVLHKLFTRYPRSD